ncbi:MAG: biotin--[acetyl-CoA-carboxylase] ligase [Thermaerobacter sp.]|nr:biotin--[acetyl-CoA-carboxylase] ligase [Thermaerobacter sp.]
MAHQQLILRALLSGAEVSGEEMSAALGVSRAMVHKEISAMRAEGLKVEARPRRGYRLLALPDRPLPWAVQAFYAPSREHPVRFLPEVTSTMEAAAAWARAGAPEGAAVATDHQVQGRGRRGRAWDDPPGMSLLSSIILRPGFSPSEAGWLPLAAAVGAAEAVERVCGARAEIKWPNDLLIGGRKLAGILIELTLEEQEIRHAVVGCGINVHQEAFPAELQSRAVSLRQTAGYEGSRAPLLAALVEEILAAVGQLQRKPAELRARWEDRSCTLGRRVKAQSPVGPLEGEAVSVDALGRLVLRLPGGEETALSAGDVTLAEARS